jgi:hypothetical protein
MGWYLPISFWAVGIIVILGGIYIEHKIEEAKHSLADHAHSSSHAKDVRFYFAIEEKALDMVSWFTVRLFYVIFGMVIFALGFVALSFVI